MTKNTDDNTNRQITININLTVRCLRLMRFRGPRPRYPPFDPFWMDSSAGRPNKKPDPDDPDYDDTDPFKFNGDDFDEEEGT